MQEQWKTLAVDPRYEVSDFGRVRSYCRFGGPHLLAPGRSASGYLTVAIGRTIGTRTLHTLVAETFIGPRPFPEAEARHLDGNKDNCRLSNLEWGTKSQNGRERKWQGAHRKLTGEQARALKARLNNRNGAALAREFGVSESLVSAIRHGKVHADA